MKKIITSILFASLGILAGNAQTQRGNVMWGASVSNIGLDFQDGNTGFSMDLTPKIGYFIKDDLAIGPEIALGINTNSGSTSFTYGVGGFGRYFLNTGFFSLPFTSNKICFARFINASVKLMR